MDDRMNAPGDLDRALAEALDVTPSADFEARVRQRIASDVAPAAPWSGWRFVLPAAAAAVVVVAAGVAMLSMRQPSTPQVLASRVVPVGPLRPAEIRQIHVDRAVERRAPAGASPLASAPAAARIEPDVLVPREDIDLYRRLIANAQNARTAAIVESPVTIALGQPISEIPIDPIRIDLIIPPVSGEGDRQ
jgi:hypothetical protein